MMFPVVDRLVAEGFSASTVCRLLAVSRSGLYEHRARIADPCARARADAALVETILEIHRQSRGTYGSPRVHAELKAEGVAIGKKRVARLMEAAGLVGASRRRSVTTTKRDPDHRPANDLVRRNFCVEKPNELWVADITFVPTLAHQIPFSGGGPTEMVLDEARKQLYVLTRFDNALSIIDVDDRVEVAHVPMYTPEPASVVHGRRFLYDAAFTSSHGDSACASCHVFGDNDGLA